MRAAIMVVSASQGVILVLRRSSTELQAAPPAVAALVAASCRPLRMIALIRYADPRTRNPTTSPAALRHGFRNDVTPPAPKRFLVKFVDLGEHTTLLPL